MSGALRPAPPETPSLQHDTLAPHSARHDDNPTRGLTRANKQ